MPIDTESFFVFILAGFIMVWSYRKGSRSTKPISDFEYLGFSALWGVVAVTMFGLIYKNSAMLQQASSNSFAFGVVLSMFVLPAGLFLGWFISECRSLYRIKRAKAKREKN